MKKQFFSILIIFLLLIVGLTGCLEEQNRRRTGDIPEDPGFIYYHDLIIDELNFTIDNYPNVDSSTSAYPINQIVACKILNASYKWDQPYFLNYQRSLVISSNNENITNFIERINRSGTHDSYMNLIDGNADLIIVARLPSDDELNYATNNSVELICKPMALDAFVFITNMVNPVLSLTVEEIQNIYTGDIKNWSQVGGDPINITAYQRNRNSGSQELMESLVMKNLTMANTPELIEWGMGGPFDQLIFDFKGNGIAYTVYYYKKFLTNTSNSIKLLGVNGITPSYENISNGIYEYITNVYTVIRDDLYPDNNAYKLRDWLLCSDGQKVVKETGYAPTSS